MGDNPTEESEYIEANWIQIVSNQIWFWRTNKEGEADTRIKVVQIRPGIFIDNLTFKNENYDECPYGDSCCKVAPESKSFAEKEADSMFGEDIINDMDSDNYDEFTGEGL